MSFVPSSFGGLAHGVDKVDACHPLVHCQFHLAGEVVDVADEAGEDEAVAGGDVGAHCVEDVLGEVGVEAVWLARSGLVGGC